MTKFYGRDKHPLNPRKRAAQSWAAKSTPAPRRGWATQGTSSARCTRSRVATQVAPSTGSRWAAEGPCATNGGRVAKGVATAATAAIACAGRAEDGGTSDGSGT